MFGEEFWFSNLYTCGTAYGKMKMNTRSRMFTILLIVSFLLIIQVMRNSLTINELLRKLRGFQDGVEATRRGAELTVDPNNSRFQKDNLMEYGKKSSTNKDRNAVWNGNSKRVTTGSFKTDSLKVHPSKQVSQTAKIQAAQEHNKKSIMKRFTTESPKTDDLKVHPSKQVSQTAKIQAVQEHNKKSMMKRFTTESPKTDNLKVHPSKQVSQTAKIQAVQEHNKKSMMKRFTTESPKTDHLKVHPRKQVLQTTIKQEHDMKDLNIYPKNDGKYLGYGESNCKRGQSELVFAKLFEHWIKLARREKIEYFLSCGTLLGAYRNGDIIPYDTDIDILVKQSDFLKIKQNSTTKPFSPYGKDIHVYVNKDFYKPFEKRRRFKCSGEVVSAQIDHCSFQELLGRVITEGHYMDIYDYTQKGDILSDPSDGGRTFHVNEVFPLRKCHLMTFETVCPNNPVKVLNIFYGNDLAPHNVCKNGTWVWVNKT